MDDGDYYFVPDPETEWTCDACGKVLPRFYNDNLCADCIRQLDEMKSEQEWKYPYYRED